MSKITLISRDFGKAASGYHKKAILQRTIASELAEKLVPHLSEGMRYADIGCGTGFLAEALDIPMMGVDIAPEMLEQAEALYESCYEADMNALPFEADSMDALLSSSTLQWANDIERTFNEWDRVTKPGGLIAFATFSYGTLRKLTEAFEMADEPHRILDFTMAEDFRDCLTQKGYEMVVYENKHHTQNHANFIAVLKSMKEIGAGLKPEKPRYLSKAALKKVEGYYRYLATQDDLLMSHWEVTTIIARKPA